MSTPDLGSIGLAALVAACTACTTSAANTRPPAPARNASFHDTGLPPLPEASGSPGDGGNYEALPRQLAPILDYLKCDTTRSARVLVHRIPGLEGRTDYMVTDPAGSRFRYWLRTFAGTGGTTGYLVQLNGCPVRSTGMRALIARAGEPPEDVTVSILKAGGFPDAVAMQKYIRQGASELYAQVEQLDRVPTVRWVSEADPDQPLRRDARAFDRRAFVHGGFLLWTGDHFEVKQKVTLAQWHCGSKGYVPCKDDPFVEIP